METSPRIELFKEGAIARGLQYSVIFAPNLASAGAVDLQFPDGQRLTGHLLWLAYTEGDQLVMIAEVTDCAGEVVGMEQNEIIFRNAFTDYEIDVKYIEARHKFCQGLVILERLPSPTRYGLTENAHLEVLTEWIAAPAPQREMRVVEAAHDGQRALTDEELGFGVMQFGSGRAFAVGDEGTGEAGIAVSKGWEQMRDAVGNVRTFLVEKVPWRNVAPEMQKLPPPQAKAGKAEPPGQPNENFLNADLFASAFIKPCEEFRQHVGFLIFEFSRFYPSDYQHGRDFVADLGAFLDKLPSGWPYGVEIRNRNSLHPDYFAMLARHGVAHIYNHWADMPPVGEQMALPGSLTNPALCGARFLLAPGRKYQDAVDLFSPYDQLKEPNPEARAAGAKLIQEGTAARSEKRKTFIYVNNRLEGNALKTIEAMLATVGE